MFIENLDVIRASLAHTGAITSFEHEHWRNQPWLKSVAAATRRAIINSRS
jgi:hypothetical protein